MSEFHIRQAAQYSPTSCALCGTHKGPFLDTGIDMPVHGWLYICVGDDTNPGCLLQAARLAGCLPPGESAELRDDHAAMSANYEQMKLIMEEQEMVIPVSREDLLAVFTEASNYLAEHSKTASNSTATLTETKPKSRQAKRVEKEGE